MAREATTRSDLATAARGVLAAASCAVLVAVLVGVAAELGAGLARPGARALEDAVGLACVVAGAGAFGVVGAGCLLTAVAAGARACGRSFARLEATAARMVPAVLRRTIAVGVTAGLVAALAGPATAAEPDAQGAGVDPRAAADVAAFDLGWQVTSAAPPPAPALPSTAEPTTAEPTVTEPTMTEPTTAPPTGTPTPETPTRETTGTPVADAPPTVTVHAGDSLWSIAAAHLPPGSDDAAVAAAWPRWYAANRSVVGDDPDLIHPGQILAVPAGGPA